MKERFHSCVSTNKDITNSQKNDGITTAMCAKDRKTQNEATPSMTRF